MLFGHYPFDAFPFTRYAFPRPSVPELFERGEAVWRQMQRRRSIRQFSSEPVPRAVIENLLLTAGSAPSGANQQPWTFCAISSPQLKRRIRQAAEEVEREFYEQHATDEWLQALLPLGTNWQTPYLETAPWLIVVFRQNYEHLPDGTVRKHFHASESVVLAAGFLLTAIHQVGLAALTHTPTPNNFLRTLLGRPLEETPVLLIPVGYPAADADVPDLERKPLSETTVWFE